MLLFPVSCFPDVSNLHPRSMVVNSAMVAVWLRDRYLAVPVRERYLP
jgi:hypothetical protein